MTSIADNVVAGLRAELETQVGWGMAAERGPFQDCESPIERALAVSLAFASRLRWDHVVFVPKGYELDQPRPIVGCYTLQIAPQYSIDQYRVDFLVGYSEAGSLSEGFIAVECDGHDFHERTKEQAQRDKSRDRHISSKVAKVVRFTGSEIFRNPYKCADEILSLAMTLMVNHDLRRSDLE